MAKSLWQSVTGAIQTFDAMTDEHVANIILHMKHYRNQFTLAKLDEIEAEAKARKLTKKFIEGAPYPFLDRRTGKWMIWSFEEDYVVPVSGKK